MPLLLINDYIVLYSSSKLLSELNLTDAKFWVLGYRQDFRRKLLVLVGRGCASSS
jgi:hypothetical protein